MILQHFIFLLSGFVCAYGAAYIMLVASKFSRVISRVWYVARAVNSLNKRGIVTFSLSAFMIAYWNIPTIFNEAVLAESVHLEMHLSLLIAGALIFIGSSSLTRRMKQISPVVAGKALGLYGLFLTLTSLNLYSAYPFAEQAYAGVALITVMLLVDFIIVPLWLYNFFGRSGSRPSLS